MEKSVTTPDLDLALQRLGQSYTALARAQRRLRGRDAMQPGRLTAPQVLLLAPLAEHGAMASGQLADAAGLTPATATHMLDQMAVGGFVERTRQEDDRRVVMTELTEQGRQLLAERVAENNAAWERALTGFDAEQLEQAVEVLDAICAFVDEL